MPKKDQLGEVAEGIESLVMWVRRQVPTTVSASTVTTLDTLLMAGPMRVTDLARRESLTQPGVTTLVNRLEKAGYAERIPDERDGRATLVRITPAGTKFLAQHHARRADALRAYLTELDDADRAALVAALPALRRLIALRPVAEEVST